MLLTSCSLFPLRQRDREIQAQIISKLKLNAQDFAGCVKSNDLFNKLNKERIRVVMFLSINSKGQVEKFRLEDQKYPHNFSECIFNLVDAISFPEIKSHELIELEQPFIFSKK